MPFGATLEIRPNKEIDEFEVGMDDEVDGVYYLIYWNEESCPYSFKTRLSASAMALGIQWGAYKVNELRK